VKKQINQSGTAIIAALFVTALVAMMAIAMMDRLSADTRRAELFLNSNQANLYAAGSLYWAMDQLINDYKTQQPNKIIDNTPIKSPTNTVNGAKIFGIIQDAEGELNINNLNDTQFQALFIRLIRLVSPNITDSAAKNMMQAALDWITPGVNNSTFDQYYATLNPPYHAPHRPMVSVSELRMVKGMTADLYEKLIPYVTALPEKTPININNAPIPILMSLDPLVTLDMAKAIDVYRKRTPFVNLDMLSNFPVVKNSPIAQNNLTVTSSYFRVQTNVIINDQHIILYSLLMRALKNSEPNITLLWQTKGTL